MTFQEWFDAQGIEGVDDIGITMLEKAFEERMDNDRTK